MFHEEIHISLYTVITEGVFTHESISNQTVHFEYIFSLKTMDQ